MLDVLFNPSNPLLWILIIAIIGGALAVMMRPFNSFAKFAYPNAKFESIGNPFVKENQLQRYLEFSSLQYFIDQLNAQKDYSISEMNAAEIQAALDQQFIQTIHMMKKDSTKKMQSFYDAYLQLLDADLLKTAFKQFLTKQEIDEQLSEHAVSETIQKQLRIFSKTAPENMRSVIQQFDYPTQIQEIISSDHEDFFFFALDAAIDTLLLNRLQQTKVPYKCKEATTLFIKRMVDIRTVKHILRAKSLGYDQDHCKQLLIDEGYELALWKQEDLCNTENISEVISSLEGTPYYPVLKKILDSQGESSSIQPYTDALDRLWLTILKNVSTSYYTTIGPTLRFLEYKKMEIRNLKIMVKGIAEHIPSKVISPLLIMEETS
ncbi:MAG: V-type ATPase subunit [Candidatus Thermoplasmatota archaeon]|nr:V-type ATPase subunit [Candidatus Thermoplasmatota archaeon]